MNDLDQNRCEDCHAPLPVVESLQGSARGIVLDADGWAYRCPACDWEHEPVDAQPPPTWRTIAPELCDEIDRLRALEVKS